MGVVLVLGLVVAVGLAVVVEGAVVWSRADAEQRVHRGATADASFEAFDRWRRCPIAVRGTLFTLAGVAASVLSVTFVTAVHQDHVWRRGDWSRRLFRVARRPGVGSGTGSAAGPGTPSDEDRRLLNVVAEAALAHDTPEPNVLVLDDEPAINLLVVRCDSLGDLLFVTGGAVRTLRRSELQAAVGHVLSQLVHGDSDLAMELTRATAGLRILDRAGREGRSLGTFDPHDRDAGTAVAFYPLAIVMGWLSAMFGRRIRRNIARINRHRQSHADADGADRLNDPIAAAAALARVANHPGGGRILNCDCVDTALLWWVDPRFPDGGTDSSHPPLAARIARLDPASDRSAGPPPTTSPSPADPEGFDAIVYPLLSIVASAGETPELADYAYARGTVALGRSLPPRLTGDDIDPALLRDAKQAARDLPDEQQRRLDDALQTAAVAANGLNEHESELLRWIGLVDPAVSAVRCEADRVTERIG